ncbi:MAG: hypothetical protein K0Q60_1717, partial [Microvirga sp.]|nr:hypothetical protein [Microvirga sp.]
MMKGLVSSDQIDVAVLQIDAGIDLGEL